MSFIKRFLETVAICLVSSFPIFFILLMEFIPPNQVTYGIVFGISAVIFYILSGISLKNSMFQLDSTAKYLTLNILIWLVFLVVSFLGMRLLPAQVYTAFFGFTKAINAFGISREWSVMGFWVIYLIEILYFPVMQIFVERKEEPLN